MGKKECRDTLFLVYIKEAMGPHKQCGGTLAVCLLYIGKKECRGTLFPPHSRISMGSNQCRGTLFLAYVVEAALSVGVHSFLRLTLMEVLTVPIV